LRVGSKGGAFGEKKISSTMARSANRIKEQLGERGVSFDLGFREQLTPDHTMGSSAESKGGGEGQA
jgi:hypothetical protein